MKKVIAVAVMLAIGTTFLGCGLSAKTNADKKPQEQKVAAVKDPSAKEQKNQANQDEQANKTTEKSSDQAAKQKREATKKIEVQVEGEKDMREATLTDSTALGFQLYVLKDFRLESEEPGKDILLSEFDGDFFARIEKLSGLTDIDKYKNEQKAGFSQSGKVTEIDPATLFSPKFRDSEFCLLTEAGDLQKGQQVTNVLYLVKDFDGTLFAITLHMPLKEAAEGITPSLWAMLSTLETR